MATLDRLAAHVSRYSAGSLVVTLAGFVSFPILTRFLSVSQYGLLALVSAILMVLVACGKGGLQNSVLRFYSEVRVGSEEFSLANYYATVVLGMGTTGLFVALGWILVSGFVPERWWPLSAGWLLVPVVALLALVRVWDSAFLNLLRAQERSGAYSLYRVFKRYGSLALVVITLLLVSRRVEAFFAATLLGELIAVLVIGQRLLREVTWRPADFSSRLLIQMVRFGVPLVGFELVSQVLEIGDRFVIQWVLGSAALGSYAAAYNMCEYANGVVVASLTGAILPTYLRLWAEGGREETREFLRRSLHFYLMAAFPVIVGLMAVGPELLTLLASSKYAAGAVIIPYVIAGMSVDGTIVIVGAGLYLRKQGARMLLLVTGSAAFNVLLNLLLVPRMGITGAAVATLASYVMLAATSAVAARRVMVVPFPAASAFKFGLLAASMYPVVTAIRTGIPGVTILLRVLAGVVWYAVLVALADRQARSFLARFGTALRRRGAGLVGN